MLQVQPRRGERPADYSRAEQAIKPAAMAAAYRPVLKIEHPLTSNFISNNIITTYNFEARATGSMAYIDPDSDPDSDHG